MNYISKAAGLYQMIGEGKWMEAFELYYADEVVMWEVGEAPRKGKNLNRLHEEQVVAERGQLNGAGVNAITSNEERRITIVESWLDFTMPNGLRKKFEQVAVQRWEDGHIIYEKFYQR